MEIKTVGIVGAGQMGSGIAHVFALAGFDVQMTDISTDSLSPWPMEWWHWPRARGDWP